MNDSGSRRRDRSLRVIITERLMAILINQKLIKILHLYLLHFYPNIYGFFFLSWTSNARFVFSYWKRNFFAFQILFSFYIFVFSDSWTKGFGWRKTWFGNEIWCSSVKMKPKNTHCKYFIFFCRRNGGRILFQLLRFLTVLGNWMCEFYMKWSIAEFAFRGKLQEIISK